MFAACHFCGFQSTCFLRPYDSKAAPGLSRTINRFFHLQISISISMSWKCNKIVASTFIICFLFLLIFCVVIQFAQESNRTGHFLQSCNWIIMFHVLFICYLFFDKPCMCTNSKLLHFDILLNQPNRFVFRIILIHLHFLRQFVIMRRYSTLMQLCQDSYIITDTVRVDFAVMCM